MLMYLLHFLTAYNGGSLLRHDVQLHLGLLESRLNDGVRLVDVRIANEKHFFRLLTQFQFDPNVLDVTLIGEIREDAM